ncbi:hypothetical protein C8R45DRAFT_943673 [Mycena sanguinolenta]|nr:hypothetical protein C8R45DRAFT_943673 [Mycena sanguinolenta]
MNHVRRCFHSQHPQTSLELVAIIVDYKLVTGCQSGEQRRDCGRRCQATRRSIASMLRLSRCIPLLSTSTRCLPNEAIEVDRLFLAREGGERMDLTNRERRIGKTATDDATTCTGVFGVPGSSMMFVHSGRRSEIAALLSRTTRSTETRTRTAVTMREIDRSSFSPIPVQLEQVTILLCEEDIAVDYIHHHDTLAKRNLLLGLKSGCSCAQSPRREAGVNMSLGLKNLDTTDRRDGVPSLRTGS